MDGSFSLKDLLLSYSLELQFYFIVKWNIHRLSIDWILLCIIRGVIINTLARNLHSRLILLLGIHGRNVTSNEYSHKGSSTYDVTL